MDKDEILDVLVKFQLENTKDFCRINYLEEFELRKWIENYIDKEENVGMYWQKMAKEFSK